MYSPARIVRGDFGGDKVRILALNPRNRERLGDLIVGGFDVSTALANAGQQALNTAEGSLASSAVNAPGVQSAATSGAQTAAANSIASWILKNQTYLLIGAGVLGAGLLVMLFMPKRG